MLISIRKRPPGSPDEPASDHPADLLLACHGRIRGFARIAGALASAGAATPPAEVAEAAAAVERYHRVALPLHEADEDLSLRPRLEAALPGSAVLDALQRVDDEHRQIDAVVAELLPLWRALAEEPDRIADSVLRLAAPTAALAALWDRHLVLEEELIFPELYRLPDATARLIAAEMRARRTPGG